MQISKEIRYACTRHQLCFPVVAACKLWIPLNLADSFVLLNTFEFCCSKENERTEFWPVIVPSFRVTGGRGPSQCHLAKGVSTLDRLLVHHRDFQRENQRVRSHSQPRAHESDQSSSDTHLCAVRGICITHSTVQP